MKKIFLLFLLFYGSVAISQSYSISAGISAPLGHEFQEVVEQNSLFTQYFDNYYIESDRNTTYDQTQIYKTKPGYYFNVNHSYHFNSKYSISTGVGISTLQFNYEAQLSFISQEIISTDTLELTTNSIPTYFQTCDVTINSFSDFEPKPGDDHTIYNLTIPIQLNFRATELFSISLGTGIRTPIATLIRDESIRRLSETENDVTTCEFYLHVDEDKSGNGFTNLRMDLLASAHFYFTDNLSLDIGTTKTINNIFYSVENASVFRPNKKYSPLYSSIGISYYFGNRLKEVKNLEPHESKI